MGLHVVLDTSVLISHLLSRSTENIPDRIINAAVRGAFTVLICDALVSECITKVTYKPYLASRIDRADLAALLTILSGFGEEVDLSDIVYPKVVRDSADDFLIALATLGRADILVTEDRDLLELNASTPFRIMTPNDFVSEIGE